MAATFKLLHCLAIAYLSTKLSVLPKSGVGTPERACHSQIFALLFNPQTNLPKVLESGTSLDLLHKSWKRPSICSNKIAGGIIHRLIQSAQNRKAEAEVEIKELEGLIAELQKQLDENLEYL
jgi:hypothetical protein